MFHSLGHEYFSFIQNLSWYISMCQGLRYLLMTQCWAIHRSYLRETYRLIRKMHLKQIITVKYNKCSNGVNNRWKVGICKKEWAVVWVAHGSSTDGNSLSEWVGVHQKPGIRRRDVSFRSGNSRCKGMNMWNRMAYSGGHNSVDSSGMENLCK